MSGCRRFASPVVVTLLLVAAASACDDDGTSPALLTESEAAEIAAFFTERATVPEPDPATVPGFPRTSSAPPFTLVATIDCPIDGTFQVAAEGERTPDTDARETAVSWSFTVAHDGCAFVSPLGPTVTIDSEGVPGTGTALWGWPSVPGGEFVMLEFEILRSGSFDWIIEDRLGTCMLTLTSTYHATTDTWTTRGEVCEHEVENNRAPLGRE